MRRFFASLLTWLALCSSAFAQANIGTAYDLGHNQSTSTGTTIVITTTHAIATGDSVIIICSDSGSVEFTSAVDSGGVNTYTHPYYSGANSRNLSVLLTTNATALASGQTITATNVSTSNRSCTAFGVSGLSATTTGRTPIFDRWPGAGQQAANQGGGTTYSAGATTATKTGMRVGQGDELLVGVLTVQAAILPNPITCGGGFTAVGGSYVNGQPAIPCVQILTDSAPIDFSPSWTTNTAAGRVFEFSLRGVPLYGTGVLSMQGAGQ